MELFLRVPQWVWEEILSAVNLAEQIAIMVVVGNLNTSLGYLGLFWIFFGLGVGDVIRSQFDSLVLQYILLIALEGLQLGLYTTYKDEKVTNVAVGFAVAQISIECLVIAQHLLKLRNKSAVASMGGNQPQVSQEEEKHKSIWELIRSIIVAVLHYCNINLFTVLVVFMNPSSTFNVFWLQVLITFNLNYISWLQDWQSHFMNEGNVLEYLDGLRPLMRNAIKAKIAVIGYNLLAIDVAFLVIGIIELAYGGQPKYDTAVCYIVIFGLPYVIFQYAHSRKKIRKLYAQLKQYKDNPEAIKVMEQMKRQVATIDAFMISMFPWTKPSFLE